MKQRLSRAAPVRVGVIGTGWVATSRHIPALRADRRASLEAVLDPNQEKSDATARRFGISGAFHDLDLFLAEPLDVVSICTPPTTHAELIRAALQAGKHVLVEKPMTMTSEEGRELETLADESGLIVCPTHNFLFSRSMLRAKSLLTSGKAGDVESAMGIQLSSWRRRLPTWFSSLPGGLFFDEAPHLLYLMRYALGDLSVESAWLGSNDGPPRSERIEARLLGDRGNAYLTMWSGAPLSEWLLVLFCTRAVLVVDIFRDILINLPPEHGHGSRDVVGQVLRGTSQMWSGMWSSGMRLMRGTLLYGHDVLIRQFLDAVITGGPPPVTARDGYEVVALMEDILSRGHDRVEDNG